MTNTTITPGTLFLAKATDWAHKDGTCPVRVHVAITEVDEKGWVWAIRGTTREHTSDTAARVAPDGQNNLLKTTYFVTADDTALVAIKVKEAGPVTGRVDQDTFNKIWDQIEAKG